MTDFRQIQEASGWLHEEHVDLPDRTRDDVARRRRVLYDAMRDLEAAVSRPRSSPGWRDGLRDALSPLAEALDEHVAEVEGEEGLFEEILLREPRMAHAVETLKKDHESLQTLSAAALDALGSQDSNEVRLKVNSVLLELARHRQKGSELIYETYAVDIATGD